MKFAGEIAFHLLRGFITWEAIIVNYLSVVLSGALGAPSSVWMAEVHIKKASSNTIPIIPLKSIH